VKTTERIFVSPYGTPFLLRLKYAIICATHEFAKTACLIASQVSFQPTMSNALFGFLFLVWQRAAVWDLSLRIALFWLSLTVLSTLDSDIMQFNDLIADLKRRCFFSV